MEQLQDTAVPITSRGADTGRKAKLAVVDTDIHEMLSSVKDLAPYLPQPWRTSVGHGGWPGPPSLPYVRLNAGGSGRVDARPPNGGPPGSDIGLMKRQLLDLYGVEYGILTSFFYPSTTGVQPAFANAAASAYNDWQAEHWLSGDARLRGSICLNANDPTAAASEIKRVATRYGVSGPGSFVQAMLPVIDRGYGEAFFDPIVRATQEVGLVLAIHPSLVQRSAIDKPTYLIEFRVALEQGIMSQLVSIVTHGVFEKYPDLRVSFLEGGWSWLPQLAVRFDDNYRMLRHEVPWLVKPPSEYIRKHVRFSTQPMETMDTAEFVRLVDRVGEESLMYSSDYPHTDFDSPIRAFPSMQRELREKIFFENAKAWYRF